MNFVHIIGRLGKDPESRFTSDGKKVTTLTVASSAYRGGQEETIWWRVSVWGDRWDKMINHLKKGKPVMFGGEMRKPEIYMDKSGQAQLSSIDISADYINFLPYGKTDEQDGQGQPQQQYAGAAKGSQNSGFDQPFGSTSSGRAPEGFGGADSEEENLPF